MDYKDGRWLSKRETILKRDEYLCQYNKRYGKTVAADTVHHIYPLEDYPEYGLCSWNLISLSNAMHNKMHDRVTGKLTKLGEELKNKTIPPTSKIYNSA